MALPKSPIPATIYTHFWELQAEKEELRSRSISLFRFKKNLIQIHGNNMGSSGQAYFYNCFLKKNRRGRGAGRGTSQQNLKCPHCGLAGPAVNLAARCHCPDSACCCVSALISPSSEAATKAFPYFIKICKRTERICHWPLGVNLLFTFLPFLSLFDSLNLFLIWNERKTPVVNKI